MKLKMLSLDCITEMAFEQFFTCNELTQMTFETYFISILFKHIWNYKDNFSKTFSKFDKNILRSKKFFKKLYLGSLTEMTFETFSYICIFSKVYFVTAKEYIFK